MVCVGLLDSPAPERPSRDPAPPEVQTRPRHLGVGTSVEGQTLPVGRRASVRVPDPPRGANQTYPPAHSDESVITMDPSSRRWPSIRMIVRAVDWLDFLIKLGSSLWPGNHRELVTRGVSFSSKLVCPGNAAGPIVWMSRH